jgi:hypothetical protein
MNFSERWIIPGGVIFYSLEQAMHLKKENKNLEFIKATDEDIQTILLWHMSHQKIKE